MWLQYFIQEIVYPINWYEYKASGSQAVKNTTIQNNQMAGISGGLVEISPGQLKTSISFKKCAMRLYPLAVRSREG